MTSGREISQRDLRMRSKEIMDAVESGESFTVTRDGREIGELIPLRHRPRFVPRLDFEKSSRLAADVDLAAFRADQESVFDQRGAEPLPC